VYALSILIFNLNIIFKLDYIHKLMDYLHKYLKYKSKYMKLQNTILAYNDNNYDHYVKITNQTGGAFGAKSAYLYAGGIIHDGHKILLLRNKDTKQYNAPGGHIDPEDNNDPHNAFVREFLEETGHNPKGKDFASYKYHFMPRNIKAEKEYDYRNTTKIYMYQVTPTDLQRVQLNFIPNNEMDLAILVDINELRKNHWHHFASPYGDNGMMRQSNINSLNEIARKGLI